MQRMMAGAMLCIGLSAGLSPADDGVVPVSGLRQRPYVAPLCCPPAGPMPGTLPPGTFDPNAPPNPELPPNPLDARLNNPFAQPTETGGQGARSFNENFDGDFGGVFYTRTITTGTTVVPTIVGYTQRVVGTTQQVTIDPNGNRVVTNVPITVNDPIVVNNVVQQRQRVVQQLAGRYSGVQIVDNDNPRPIDRVYFGYNAYINNGASLAAPGVGGSDVYRQSGGFEKTFLNGDASIGMRLPFIQQYGPLGASSQVVGDLTVLLKYAFYNNTQTGDVATVGFALTTPTGGGTATLLDGSTAPHSWLLQPWAGFVRNAERFYVQGISNLIVPTDRRDPTIWGNSLGMGYWLYRNPNDRFLTGITPIAEFHVRTPLSNRDPNGQIFLQDQVNLTTGVHFRFNRAVISGAVCVPLVGPKPWDIEAMGFMNYQF